MQNQVKNRRKKISLDKRSGFSFGKEFMKLLFKASVKAIKTIVWPYLKDLFQRFFRNEISLSEIILVAFILGTLEVVIIKGFQFTLELIAKFK